MVHIVLDLESSSSSPADPRRGAFCGSGRPGVDARSDKVEDPRGEIGPQTKPTSIHDTLAVLVAKNNSYFRGPGGAGGWRAPGGAGREGGRLARLKMDLLVSPHFVRGGVADGRPVGL